MALKAYLCLLHNKYKEDNQMIITKNYSIIRSKKGV